MRPQLIEPGEEIPVRLTTRQRDLILEHTFIEPELEKRLRIAVTEGASIVVGLTRTIHEAPAKRTLSGDLSPTAARVPHAGAPIR